MLIRTERDPIKVPTSTVESLSTCRLTPNQSLKPGTTCPRCGIGIIDYDSLLELVCPVCGLKEAGACT